MSIFQRNEDASTFLGHFKYSLAFMARLLLDVELVHFVAAL